MKQKEYIQSSIGMNELEQLLYSSLLEQCDLDYQRWIQNQPKRADDQQANWIEFLKVRIGQEMSALETLRQHYGRFVRAIKTAPKPEDQQQVILNFSRDLGATPEDLKKDAVAFARWFGADAMTDRYNRRHTRHEQYASFLLERLGSAIVSGVRDIHRPKDQMAYWKMTQLENLVKPLLVHDGDVRLKLAAFRCLASVLSTLAQEIQELAVDDTTLQYIYRSALQHEQHVWIQCVALDLLATLSWVSFERALQQRLLHPGTGDDMFVRRRAVQLMAMYYSRLSCTQLLIPAVLSDPNPFVRQALPMALLQAPAAVAAPAFERLVTTDASPQVRAAAWLEWPRLMGERQYRERALRIFRLASWQEKDEFVLRVICLIAERCTEALRLKNDPFVAAWHPTAQEVLLFMRCNAASAKVRRWASQSLEFIWSEFNLKARILRECIAALVRSIPRGHSQLLPAEMTEFLDPVFVGRVCSVVCRRDYDVQLQSTSRGYKVIRGHVFGFRWWRWWHELRHPSPDKRQAFQHTIGRLFDGEFHIPSSVMSELAQTKVPGEPLHISAEGGWRPFLPLPDELTSCIEFGRTPKPFCIFTAEGTTIITPPSGWKQRWRAAWKLTWNFRHYAEKRNWLESMQEPPSSYISALNELGFKIHFETYPDEEGKPLPADSMVERFFPKVEDDGGDAPTDEHVIEGFFPGERLPSSRYSRKPAAQPTTDSHA